MSANEARFCVTTMPRMLGVSPSGCYASCRCRPSARARADAALTARVQAIHARSRRPEPEHLPPTTTVLRRCPLTPDRISLSL